MPPSEHSIYSPSGMADKLLCPGKHLATLGMVSKSSPAAERGTECHEWAEDLIMNSDSQVPEFLEDWQEECTRDMVAQALEIYDELSIGGDVEMKLEMKVHLSWLGGEYHKEVYGTADVILYCHDSKTLVVLDYKTGKGIPVSPVNNVQGMIYALGAMGKYPDAENIVIVISQPRVHNELVHWVIGAEKLIEWNRDILAPALITMNEPDAPFTPGEKQCKWCPINGTCTAQKTQYLDLLDNASKAHVKSPEITIEELNDLLLRVKEIRAWTNAVESKAHELMENGTPLPDFKLVRGRGSRAWKDPVQAEKFMIGQKLKDKERHTYKLLSVARCEKVLKENLNRKITRNNFNKLVDVRKGKITWALKTDKREAVVMAPPVEELVNFEDLL